MVGPDRKYLFKNRRGLNVLRGAPHVESRFALAVAASDASLRRCPTNPAPIEASHILSTSALTSSRGAREGFPPVVLESVDAFMARVTQLDLTRCPHCADGRLRVIAALPPLRRTYAPRSSTGPPL